MSAGLEPRALVAGAQPVCGGAALGPVAGGNPVAARARGHSQLAAGCRRFRGGRELSAAIQHLWRWCPTSTAATGTSGRSQFFSQYNLPEVGIYLGVLPLIALITLLHPRWPSRIAPRDRLTWYAVGVFGLSAGAGLEHAAGASVQPHPPLRPSAAAEPQHDHRGHRGLASCSRGGSTGPTRRRSTSVGDATTGSWLWCRSRSSRFWPSGR